MNRRDLIQRVLLGGTVLVLIPSVLESCTKMDNSNPETTPGITPGTGSTGSKIDMDLSLPDNSSLSATGSSKIVQNILIINTGGGKFSALSSICTHQGCTVGYNSGSGNVECPCHGSVFSTSGSVVNGPAATSLRAYSTSLIGNILTITT
jgi:cytochrome b6-f complex iron-sulfur subunit